jgi:hypothetical protein
MPGAILGKQWVITSQYQDERSWIALRAEEGNTLRGDEVAAQLGLRWEPPDDEEWEAYRSWSRNSKCLHSSLVSTLLYNDENGCVEQKSGWPGCIT